MLDRMYEYVAADADSEPLIGVAYRAIPIDEWRCRLRALAARRPLLLGRAAMCLLSLAALGGFSSAPLIEAMLVSQPATKGQPVPGSVQDAAIVIGIVSAFCLLLVLPFVVQGIILLWNWTFSVSDKCVAYCSAVGLHDCQPNGLVARLPWTHITDIRNCGGDLYFVGLSPGSGILIPRNAFCDRATGFRFQSAAFDLWKASGDASALPTESRTEFAYSDQ